MITSAAGYHEILMKGEIMRNFFWSNSNSKLNKTAKAWKDKFGLEAKFVSFNIPRLKSQSGQVTCPYAGVCADVCYADQGRLAMAPAKRSRERNLEHINRLKMHQVRDMLIEDIESMRSVTHVRLHDSGDFFSRPYYHTWIDVAKSFSSIIFYAYTKSIPFLDWDAHPDNFRIVQSLGGKRDLEIDRGRPHSRICINDEDRIEARYCDGNSSDLPAILGEIRIGLVYHGNRNLKPENLTQLRIARRMT